MEVTYGYGYGYGSGYGSGDEFMAAIASQYARKPKPKETLAFWKSDRELRSANGGRGAPFVIGKRHSVEGPLSICSSSALHGSYAPWKWKGERLFVVALHGETQRDGDKVAALSRTIIKEVGGMFGIPRHPRAAGA